MNNNFFRTLLLVLCLMLFGCAAKNQGVLEETTESKILSQSKAANLQKDIKNKFDAKTDNFNSCFESENKNGEQSDYPALKKLMSLVTLERNGDIKASDIISIQPVSDGFKKCIASVISSIEFEPLGFDEPVLIFYPLEYKKNN